MGPDSVRSNPEVFRWSRSQKAWVTESLAYAKHFALEAMPYGLQAMGKFLGSNELYMAGLAAQGLKNAETVRQQAVLAHKNSPEFSPRAAFGGAAMAVGNGMRSFGNHSALAPETQSQVQGWGNALLLGGASMTYGPNLRHRLPSGRPVRRRP